MKLIARTLMGTEQLESRNLLAADVAALYDSTAVVSENNVPLTYVEGDANRDGTFDQADIVQVLRAGKYLSSDNAVWHEGDWNGDGRFNQLDIVSALQSGSYLSEAFRASTGLVPLRAQGTGFLRVVGFDPATGVATIGSVGDDVSVGTLLGKQTGSIQFQVNIITGEQTVPTVSVFGANGKDSYVAVYEEIGPDPSDPTNPNKLKIEAKITGGTGRFAGATGNYTILSSSDATLFELLGGAVDQITFTYTLEGQISRPVGGHA